MSQKRMPKSNSDHGRSNDTYTTPDIDATLARAAAVTQKVRVVHGANEEYFSNLDGKTVGSVKKSLREVFNIPGDAQALVSNKEVGDDFVLDGGMSLEFVKEAGVKGYLRKPLKSGAGVEICRETPCAELIEILKNDEKIDIQERAYYKWLNADQPDGDGVDFWLEAEAEMLDRKD